MTIVATTYNVAHGRGTDLQFNFQRQVDVFAGSDIVAIQERSGAETGWNTPLTNAGFTEAIYKPNQIGGSDGNAIWYKSSKITILKTYECQLSIGAQTGWSGTNVDKCAVAALCLSEGQKFYFVCTHLCQSAGADSSGALTSVIRDNQIKTLLQWQNAELLSYDVMVLGDFNLTPGHLAQDGRFEIDLFTAAGFIDQWRQGIAEGKATVPWADLNADSIADRAVDDNTPTSDTRRVDWAMVRTVNRALSLSSIKVQDTRATCSTGLTGSPLFCPDTDSTQRWGNSGDYGVRPSDHDPVEVQLTVNARAVSPVRASQFSWQPLIRL